MKLEPIENYGRMMREHPAESLHDVFAAWTLLHPGAVLLDFVRWVEEVTEVDFTALLSPEELERFSALYSPDPMMAEAFAEGLDAWP